MTGEVEELSGKVAEITERRFLVKSKKQWFWGALPGELQFRGTFHAQQDFGIAELHSRSTGDCEHTFSCVPDRCAGVHRASAVLCDHFDWLAQRHYFLPNRPPRLEQDGVAVLGLSLALRQSPALSRHRPWLEDFTSKALRALQPATWDSALIAAACIVLDVSLCETLVPSMMPEIVVALCEKGVLGSYRAMGGLAWSGIIGMHGLDEGPCRAATLLVAFNRLVADSIPARLANVELDDVRRIALALPRAMKRWTWDEEAKTPRSVPGRWDVEHEYHLQNLLWAILAPLFPDLDDEEYLKSIGQRQPRYDLAVPTLNLIIEAKFVRRGKPFSKVIGEIAEDVALYLRTAGTPWRHIIAVVWDDAARTEEHHEFLQGLRSLDGVAEAVVISRPARMSLPSQLKLEKRGRGTRKRVSKPAAP